MLTMFDSTDVSQIPSNATAVAGYTGGRWPTYPVLLKHFPNAHVLSIAVASYYDAECLDIEPGDATNDVAPAWVKRQQARGVKRPVLYTSVANVNALLAVLKENGILRQDIRLWTAHYTGKPHLCGPMCWRTMNSAADATQYTNHALGRTLDASLVSDSFFAKPVDPKAKKRVIWRKRQAADQKLAKALKAKLKAALDRITRRKKLLG